MGGIIIVALFLHNLFETTHVVFLWKRHVLCFYIQEIYQAKGDTDFSLPRVNYFFVSLSSFNPTLYTFGLQTLFTQIYMRNQKHWNLLISFICFIDIGKVSE